MPRGEEAGFRGRGNLSALDLGLRLGMEEIHLIFFNSGLRSLKWTPQTGGGLGWQKPDGK